MRASHEPDETGQGTGAGAHEETGKDARNALGSRKVVAVITEGAAGAGTE